MYNAFWKNSDYVLANIIMIDNEAKSIDENCRKINSEQATYHLAQMFQISGKTTLKMVPLSCEVISKLQMAEEELQELAKTNKKRFQAMLCREENFMIKNGKRRGYGRK